MKGAEVHNMKDDELVAKLMDAQEEAFNLRFRHATGRAREHGPPWGHQA